MTPEEARAAVDAALHETVLAMGATLVERNTPDPIAMGTALRILALYLAQPSDADNPRAVRKICNALAKNLREQIKELRADPAYRACLAAAFPATVGEA